MANKKKRCYQTKIHNAGNQNKMCWQVVSELSNKNRILNNIAIKNDGELFEDPCIVSNIFNNYFLQAPLSLIQKIDRKRGNDVGPAESSNLPKNF